MSLISNFVSSSINHAKDGFRTVDKSIYNDRLNICQNCEFFDSTAFRCKQCGCFLNIKANWASESCPLEKWKDIPQENKSNLTESISVPSIQTNDCGCNKKNV